MSRFQPSEHSYAGVWDTVTSYVSGEADAVKAKALAYKAIADVNATAVQIAVSDAKKKADAAVDTTTTAIAWLPWLGAGALGLGFFWIARRKGTRNPASPGLLRQFGDDLTFSVRQPLRTARSIGSARGSRAKADAYVAGASGAFDHSVGLGKLGSIAAMFGIPL